MWGFRIFLCVGEGARAFESGYRVGFVGFVGVVVELVVGGFALSFI